MNPISTTKVTLFCSKKMSCWCLYFLKKFSNIILHYITTFTDIKCVYISTFPAYISNWMFTNHMAFLHTYLLGFLDVCSTIICRAMFSLIQKKLWYKVRNQVHFEWYFRWCFGIPKYIETPAIFRNIIFHEFPLNMEYPWQRFIQDPATCPYAGCGVIMQLLTRAYPANSQGIICV